MADTWSSSLTEHGKAGMLGPRARTGSLGTRGRAGRLGSRRWGQDVYTSPAPSTGYGDVYSDTLED